MRTSAQMLVAFAALASITSAAPALEKRDGEDGSIFGGGKGDGGAPGGKFELPFPFEKRQTAGTGFGPFKGGSAGTSSGPGKGSGFLGIFPGGSSGTDAGAGTGASFGPFKGGPSGSNSKRQTAGTSYGNYPGGAAGGSPSSGEGASYGDYPGGASGSSNDGSSSAGQSFGDYPGGAAGKRDLTDDEVDMQFLMRKRQSGGCYTQCALQQAGCYTFGGLSGNYGNPQCQSAGSACYAKCGSSKRDVIVDEVDSDFLMAKRQSGGCYTQCALQQAGCYTLGGLSGNYGNPQCQSAGSACYAQCA